MISLYRNRILNINNPIAMSEQILFLEDFCLTSLLGRGHRSEVRLGERGTDILAIKCIKRVGKDLYDSRSYREYLNEIKVISSLSHPNIITMKGHGDSFIFNTETFTRESTLYIIFEYAKGGNLKNFIEKTDPFSEQLAQYYFSLLLDALSYLHESGIAHRDIKPENILIDASLNILLADFDLAGKIGMRKGIVGTRGYMSPEIEAGIQYCTEAADIFALGVTLLFMVSGVQSFKRTYGNINYNALFAHPVKFWKKYEENRKFTDEFKDLIGKMLAKNPKERPTIIEIKEHPWMKNHLIPELELILEKLLRKEKI